MSLEPLCDCHQVPPTRVQEAIEAGARNVDAVGEATRAGTGCGGCRPDIRRRLRRARWARWFPWFTG